MKAARPVCATEFLHASPALRRSRWRFADRPRGGDRRLQISASRPTAIKDFKGRKIGYTNPRSTSQGLGTLLLDKTGLKAGDAELVPPAASAKALLDTGLVDVAPFAEAAAVAVQAKYRIVRQSERAVAAPGQRGGRDDLQHGRPARRLCPRRIPGATPRRRLHDRQSARGRRHRRQGLQSRSGGGAGCGAQSLQNVKPVLIKTARVLKFGWFDMVARCCFPAGRAGNLHRTAASASPLR